MTAAFKMFLGVCFVLTPCRVMAQQDNGASTGEDKAAPVSRQSCNLTAGGESTVLNVAGQQTLRLADGRFVRLADVLVPTSSFAETGFNPASAASDFLKRTVLGKRVEIRFSGTQRDRYGVFVGHVFVEGDTNQWLQKSLIQAGLAQAYPGSQNQGCMQPLYDAEDEARLAKRGHWGIALLKVYPATDPKALLNLSQTYQIIEGRVIDTTSKSGRLLLHFGQDKDKDFTAAIEQTVIKQFKGPEKQPLVSGVKVRLRGWIDRRRGPVMAITSSAQIEFLDGSKEN